MDTDKWLESLIPDAIRILTITGRRNSRNCILLGHHPIHEDYRETWRTLTPGQRAYLGLFMTVIRHQHSEALSLLTQDQVIIEKILRELYNSRNGYRRDVVNISFRRHLLLIEKYRQQPERRRFPRWGPQDIPAEAFSIDQDPEWGNSSKVKASPVREIQGPAGPVRQVTIEEYNRTRRVPSPKGVALEYDKENKLSQEWAKDSHTNDDKIYDGTEPEWYRSRHKEET